MDESLGGSGLRFTYLQIVDRMLALIALAICVMVLWMALMPRASAPSMGIAIAMTLLPLAFVLAWFERHKEVSADLSELTDPQIAMAAASSGLKLVRHTKDAWTFAPKSGGPIFQDYRNVRVTRNGEDIIIDGPTRTVQKLADTISAVVDETPDAP